MLVVHIVQSVQMFPDLRALVDREAPVIVVDHAIHLYHGALGGRFLREHGTTWGFDPFFMAGYPETPLWDSSSNLSILFQWLAGGDYSPLAYKLGLLACMILALGAIAVGTLAAGLGRWEAALATLLGWLYFWIGFPIALWRSGLFSFVLASAGLVLLLGLALRFDARPTPGRWGTLTATGTALFFAHVTAPILALGAMVGYLATTPRRHGRRWSAALALGAVLVVAANLFWLTPLWRFRGIRTPAFGFLSTDTAWFLREFYLGGGVDGRVSLALLILGVAGLATWWAGGTGERARAATFTGSAVVLLVLFGFGSLWPVTRVLEPLRYRVPLHLLLAVPAASALRRGASWLARARGRPSRSGPGLGRRAGGARRDGRRHAPPDPPGRGARPNPAPAPRRRAPARDARAASLDPDPDRPLRPDPPRRPAPAPRGDRPGERPLDAAAPPATPPRASAVHRRRVSGRLHRPSPDGLVRRLPARRPAHRRLDPRGPVGVLRPL
ncbi:MAG: hypothetical protein JO252_00185 [Planctomycetaceae bacterium]|nr:hypothetical protein [Planctomycetaceae bacterium]